MAKQSKATNAILWTIQGLLAAVFLFAGSMKFILPIEMMTASMPLPGLFIRFIGLCEVAGAFGLVLPWLLKIQPRLTSLAAAGLVVIMTGATVISTVVGPVETAAMPLVVGLLAAAVAYGRRPVSNRRSGETRTLQLAA